ncbi:MAG: carbohydrate binding family 9 domain-containing protein [bacterium]|nr:carbohydrate binding family 9 domain-containing protein [bacterium]
MKPTYIILLFGLFVLAFLTIPTLARDADKIVTAVRVETPPVLDGTITAEEYPAEPATGFTQFRPEDGIPALEKTEVYVVYDDDAIYFGWICYEDKPGELVASAMVRDAVLNNDDSIDIMFDTNNDLETSYDFMTNPLGTKYDGLYARDGSSGGPEWDGVWDVVTAMGEDRWTAEFRIPWENFTYSPNVTEMGLQLYRNMKPDYEDVTWAGDSTNLASIPHFGTLKGLTGLKPPKRFTFLPYGTIRGEQYPSPGDPDVNDSEVVYDGGLDFEFNGGKVLTFNATLNPDYAHIEADPEQIQLDPSNIFLFEKRPFFTEANSIFATGSAIEPLYTRSMTDILAGAKFTGTAGKFSYGAMDVQLEGEDPVFPGDNVSTARVTFAPYEKSYIGALLVGRYGLGERTRISDIDEYNVVAAIDSELAFGESFYLRTLGTKSITKRHPETEQYYDLGKDYALLGQFRYQPDFFTSLAIGYIEIQENYQSDVSFLQAFDVNRREAWMFGRKDIYLNNAIIRDVAFNNYYTHWWRLDTNATINNYWNPSGTVIFTNDLFVSVFGNLGRDGRFYMYGIPDYEAQRTLNAGLSFGNNMMSWGQLRGEYWRGGYFGAEYNNYELETTFIPFAKLQIGLDVELTDPILDRNDPGYTWEADEPFGVANLRVVNNIAENLYWRAIMQGNTANDVYLGSALVAWTYLPGSTAYIAYEEQRLDSSTTGDFELIDRQVFLKVSYMLNI